MVRSYHSVNSFKNGELSPMLNGRFDIQEYQNGAEVIENFFPLRSGGIARRPGSRFLADITSFGACRVITFRGTDADYLLLLRDHAAVDCFGVYLTDGTAGTVAANYLGAVYNGVDVQGWRFAAVKLGASDRLIMTHVSGDVPPVIVTFAAAPSIIVAPWITGGPSNEWGTTSAVGQDFEPYFMRVPYQDRNRTSTTITNSAATGAITLTASANLFVASDVGKFVRIVQSTNEGVAQITGYTSPTVVDATVGQYPLAASSASANWSISAWNSTDGWPRQVAVYNQRLVFASSPTFPSHFWVSILGAPGLFMQEKMLQDKTATTSTYHYFGAESNNDAFHIAASSSGKQGLHFIQWMAPGDTLEFGTGEIEGTIFGTDGKFGKLNIDIKYKSFEGGGDIQPAKGGRSTFYVSRDGKSLREFKYSPENGSYVSKNLSILNPDIHTKNLTSGAAAIGISKFYMKELTWQDSRNILWMICNMEPGGTDGGQLIGLTFEPDTETVGWHRQNIQGASRIHGLAALPNASNRYDKLYMVVERTINSSTAYYIEFLGNDFEGDSYSGITSTNEDEYPWFLDCAERVVNSPASTTVSGIGHLQGESVYAWADGEIQGPFTVSGGGSITLTTAAARVIVGLRYTSKLKSMDLVFQGPYGNIPDTFRDSSKITFKVYRSYTGQYGPDADTLHDFEYDDSDLFTGDLIIDLENTPGQEFRYYVEQTDPYPLTILGVFFRGVIGGGE